MPTAQYIEYVHEEWKEAFPGRSIECEPVAAYMATISQILSKKVDAELRKINLTRGEMEVLCAIVRTKDHTLTPKLVRERMIVSSGGLTARIDKLEAAGLIKRLQDPSDNRGFLLKATGKGLEMGLAAHKVNVEMEKQLLSSLSAKEKNEMKRMLQKIMVSLEQS